MEEYFAKCLGGQQESEKKPTLKTASKVERNPTLWMVKRVYKDKTTEKGPVGIWKPTKEEHIMHTCDICGFKSSRRFNMVRHKNIQHGIEESEGSDDQSQAQSGDIFSDNDSRSLQSDDSSYKESDDEEDSNAWDSIVNKTFNTHQTEYEEKVKALIEDGYNKPQAHSLAYNDMSEKYRDEMKDHYLATMMWHQKIRRDPVHRKISKTAKRLREEEDYDTLESWKYAVEKRKYLLDDVLACYDPPPTDDSNDTM